jgi:putative colanic acid biosynthesis acetyltransferase WcaF
MTKDLSKYNNDWYHPGSLLKRTCWFFVNAIFFRSGFLPFYGIKRGLLRAFGATVGHSVVIKPWVNIKYPWKLSIGNNTWIGEGVWIDNLGEVSIGNNVCLSQGAYLLTGNHDYKKTAFDLLIKPIRLEDGVWIGAKAIVCPGVTCFSHAVLSVGAVATGNLEAEFIYQGNPAEKVRRRVFEEQERVEVRR